MRIMWVINIGFGLASIFDDHRIIDFFFKVLHNRGAFKINIFFIVRSTLIGLILLRVGIRIFNNIFFFICSVLRSVIKVIVLWIV